MPGDLREQLEWVDRLVEEPSGLDTIGRHRVMLLHDLALARRLEAAHAREGELAAEADRRLRPESGAASAPLAGGVLCFCGRDSFLTHALGLGVDGPVSDEELALLEAFFFERGAAVEIDLCPFADPTLPGRLFDRGYRPDHYETVLVQEMPAAGGERLPLTTAAAGLTIREAAADDLEDYARLLFEGFEAPSEAETLFAHIAELNFETAGRRSWIAEVGEEPAGCGSMSLEGGVASLSGAATLPGFRGRGIQSALIAERLERAHRDGADLAVVTTEVGSVSQRNVERAGFHPAYTRSVLIKPRPEGRS